VPEEPTRTRTPSNGLRKPKRARTPPAPPLDAADPPAPGQQINDLLELLGRRWALRILWELREGTTGFRALRTACGDVSTSVLSQRLRELREAGLVSLEAHRYELTPRGAELREHLVPLEAWARRWAARDTGQGAG
jgi:DNA-binding HxlR family transcriptional regulator